MEIQELQGEGDAKVTGRKRRKITRGPRRPPAPNKGDGLQCSDKCTSTVVSRVQYKDNKIQSCDTMDGNLEGGIKFEGGK